jgi:hypothetical protein
MVLPLGILEFQLVGPFLETIMQTVWVALLKSYLLHQLILTTPFIVSGNTFLGNKQKLSPKSA